MKKTKYRGLVRRSLAAGIFTSMTAFAHAAPNMSIGSDTTQPIGHYELCNRMPSECRPLKSNVARTVLTRDIWARMVDVNNAVNISVQPVTDQELWGREEVWSYPNGKGDCEDYVLMKRRLLMRAGIPENNLPITVVRQADGSGHAVLTVVTDRGDFVLDNLRGDIRLWNETGYTFLKRQSPKNSGRWVALLDSGNPAVAALR